MNPNDEINFAYKVRHALNENLDNLPAKSADRLTAARNIALSRKKPDAPQRVLASRGVLAGHMGNLLGEPLSWLNRVGIAVPLLVLVVGLIGIYQFEQQYHIREIADIDAAVLSDELPLNAYLDRGFNAYLSIREE